jgi:hypothetical protein
MALIKCHSCGIEVSDQAITCPKCGQPFRNTTIELTNKKWKLTKLFGWVFLVLGIYLLGSGSQNGGFQNPMTGMGVCVVLISLAVLVVGRIGAWWSNK